MIPLVMRLKAVDINKGRKQHINLWLPLFLLWLILSPLCILIFLAWILMRTFGLISGKSKEYARLLEAGYEVLNQICGLDIDFRSGESHFILHF